MQSSCSFNWHRTSRTRTHTQLRHTSRQLPFQRVRSPPALQPLPYFHEAHARHRTRACIVPSQPCARMTMRDVGHHRFESHETRASDKFFFNQSSITHQPNSVCHSASSAFLPTPWRYADRKSCDLAAAVCLCAQARLPRTRHTLDTTNTTTQRCHTGRGCVLFSPLV
jgi:hypothetical protein